MSGRPPEHTWCGLPGRAYITPRELQPNRKTPMFCHYKGSEVAMVVCLARSVGSDGDGRPIAPVGRTRDRYGTRTRPDGGGESRDGGTWLAHPASAAFLASLQRQEHCPSPDPSSTGH